MKEKLSELLKNAYAPYSNYQVACIALMKDGSEACGVNYENASYGATICAERNAIGSAIASGYTKGDFEELFVMTNSDKKPGTCCFMCRQVIQEFFSKESKVTCMNNLGESLVFTVGELCPYPFDEEDLV